MQKNNVNDKKLKKGNGIKGDVWQKGGVGVT